MYQLTKPLTSELEKTIGLIRHRLDQLTRPKFEREEVEALMVEIVAQRGLVARLTAHNMALYNDYRSLKDQLHGTDVEIGRLREAFKQAHDMINSLIAHNNRCAAEAPLTEPARLLRTLPWPPAEEVSLKQVQVEQEELRRRAGVAYRRARHEEHVMTSIGEAAVRVIGKVHPLNQVGGRLGDESEG